MGRSWALGSRHRKGAWKCRVAEMAPGLQEGKVNDGGRTWGGSELGPLIGRAFPRPHQEVVWGWNGGHWSLGQVLGE